MSGSGSSVFGLFASAASAQRALAALAPTPAVYVTDLQPSPAVRRARVPGHERSGDRLPWGTRLSPRAAGAWPSGKATGFGPADWRFESPAPARTAVAGRAAEESFGHDGNERHVCRTAESFFTGEPAAGRDRPGRRAGYAHEVRAAQGYAPHLRAAVAGLRARRGGRPRPGAPGRGDRARSRRGRSRPAAGRPVRRPGRATGQWRRRAGRHGSPRGLRRRRHGLERRRAADRRRAAGGLAPSSRRLHGAGDHHHRRAGRSRPTTGA